MVDLNRDGILDGMNGGALLVGKGDGSFQVQEVTITDSSAGLVQGDFNHDGALDVAVASAFGNVIDVILNTGAK